MKIDVIGLDVWGHGSDHKNHACRGDCEPWTVNDTSRVGSFHIADTATDLEIFRALQAGNYLGHALAFDDVAFDWPDAEFCAIDRADDGCPFLHLQVQP